MSPKELEKLAKVCQKFGITRLKTADIELSLDTTFSPPTTNPATEATPASDPQFSEEDALYWSSNTPNQ